MSSQQPNNSLSGPEPKKSNTTLIVIIALAVVTIPVLCICGGAAVSFFWALQMERDIHIEQIQNEQPINVVPSDIPTELVPPVRAVPPPIEAAPTVESAPKEESQSGDEASTK